MDLLEGPTCGPTILGPHSGPTEIGPLSGPDIVGPQVGPTKRSTRVYGPSWTFMDLNRSMVILCIRSKITYVLNIRFSVYKNRSQFSNSNVFNLGS